MQYRENSPFESLARLLLYSLMWTGAIGIAWNLLKPGGWLFHLIDLMLNNQPQSFYYAGVAVLGLIAGKIWLDSVVPRAFYNLLTAGCAFAGTLFILQQLLPI
jgi:hypothetical protein